MRDGYLQLQYKMQANQSRISKILNIDEYMGTHMRLYITYMTYMTGNGHRHRGSGIGERTSAHRAPRTGKISLIFRAARTSRELPYTTYTYTYT